MIASQLILLEGMPSTGKTTNARLIHTQLERGGINAKWIHEVATPHPVLFFEDAGLTRDEYDRFINTYPDAAGVLGKAAIFGQSTVSIPLPEIEWYHRDEIGEDAYQALRGYDTWSFPLDVYIKFALEKWGHFAEQALKRPDEVYIIDSAIFQYQIFSFLFQNRPYAELESFVLRLADLVRPLNPCLLYLYRDNTEATIDYLERDRGTGYLEYLWNRDKDRPYYADKPPGAESFKRFLRDYAGMAGLLFDAVPFRKASFEISDGDWPRHEDDMLAFLGASRIPCPDALPQNGVYANEALGFVIEIDGLSMKDPTGMARKLIPKSQHEFYVDWLPVILHFDAGRIIIAGSQICERWTATGTIYVKSEV